ncbi:MAG: SAM-dependent chlorinase/fluorinase [Candidatus Latescibacteria bacterium]|nr:SAM-dependent chlorinase/fluorinase [Candidatus Latescibacterota bacterium]
MAIITILTDFGVRDGFVGTMKGVILGINPAVTLVDLAHDIAPQDIEEAAFLLRNAYRYFPSGTIHVVVVDPGVGSTRRALIVESPRHTFVGPDNGVFAYIYRMEPEARVTAVTNPAYCLPERSRTFHGRDVFAPVAAHLSRGVSPSACGVPAHDYVRGEVTEPVITPDRIDGHIIHTDRFGNAITDIPEDRFIEATRGRAFRVEITTCQFDRLSQSYADVPDGSPLAIFGSAGLLEVAVNGGNAAQALGLKRGDPVSVKIVTSDK